MLIVAVLLLGERAAAGDNQLTAEETAAGWQLLFNGTDYAGWITSSGREIGSAVEDGSLVPYRCGGYLLVHERQFGDFELQCDVKLSGEQCNSGIFFRVGDLKDPVQTGFEIQIYDGGTSRQHFGAIYDLVPPSENRVKPIGDWNHLVVTCQGPNVSVEVNGKVVARMDADQFDTPGVRPDGSRHKFRRAIKDFPRTGYVGFQDHGHKVWVKNIKIREL